MWAVSGTGSLTQSGGNNSFSWLNIGSNAGSNGIYSLSGNGQLSGIWEYVGNSGSGTFTQSGGTHSVSGDLYLGFNPGSVGTYSLSGAGQLSAAQVYIGGGGSGSFLQSGGTSTSTGSLNIGWGGNVTATYSLSSSGQLSAATENVGMFGGTAIFAQSGGTNTILSGGVLSVGYDSGSGTYGLSGSGQLLAANVYVGSSGTGTFTQTGGTHTIGTALYLGYNLGYNTSECGTYSLGGSGLLSARSEYVGCVAGTTASFEQSGGTNAVSLLSIGSGGAYTLGGGVLQASGLLSQGVFAGGAVPAVLNGSGILDLSSGTWQNLGEISLSIGANSLFVVPAGFNPYTAFASFSNLGLTHTSGTTLAVPAGQGFAGPDYSTGDTVNCQGTIMATSGGTINLSGELTLSGTGTVNLGSGNLTTNDPLSGISGGSLFVVNHYVGNGGTGTFTQSGGTNNISSSLCLGDSAADSGTYNLGGSSQLSASTEYVGYSGTGTLAQTGGTNSIVQTLLIGYYSTPAIGNYTLSGNGRLSAQSEFVGDFGTGTFTQSGGTNLIQVRGSLYLGDNAGGGGAYNLSGNALLSASSEYVGYSGTGSFTQSGGTHSISNSLYLGYNAGGTGAYNLSGNALLSASSEYVGYFGSGAFTQSGGTHSISNSLYLGSNAGGSGTFSLNSGELSAPHETVGNSGTGSFTQYGGTNTASFLSIGSSGSYLLAGGTLQVNGYLANLGTFAGDGAPATLDANGIVDLSKGENMGAFSVSVSANSLLIVPPGFNPCNGFRQLR